MQKVMAMESERVRWMAKATKEATVRANRSLMLSLSWNAVVVEQGVAGAEPSCSTGSGVCPRAGGLEVGGMVDLKVTLVLKAIVLGINDGDPLSSIERRVARPGELSSLAELAVPGMSW